VEIISSAATERTGTTAARSIHTSTNSADIIRTAALGTAEQPAAGLVNSLFFEVLKMEFYCIVIIGIICYYVGVFCGYIYKGLLQ
jgi:hypothetical protein